MKPGLNPILGISFAVFMIVSCKKESIIPVEKIESIVSTSGGAWGKVAKQGTVNPKKQISEQSKKNLQKEIYNGRFYTSYGVIDGIRFYSKNGNEVNLERSRSRGAEKTYNCVTAKQGRFTIYEELAAGLSKLELIRMGENEEWPDHIMERLKN